MIYIFGATHPGQMRAEHLCLEHLNVHAVHSVIKTGHKSRYGDISVFNNLGTEGLGWLELRHELIRIEMEERWGEKHSFEDNRTPLALGGPHRMLAGALWADAPETFAEQIQQYGFPSTTFPTPWDRWPEMSREGYLLATRLGP